MSKGTNISIFLGVLLFALIYVGSNRFASVDQNLVASSNVIVSTSAPTVDDDIDLNILKGTLWVYLNNAVYVNEDNTDGAAVWTDITAAGATINFEEGDVLVISNASVLDFGAGFDCTQSPAGECNLVIDYTEDPVNLASGEITGTLDISDNTNLAAGTGATLTGDTISVDLGTAIDTSEITDGTIDEADIDANTPTDEYCLTYEAAGATIFEWQICGSSAGTLNTIQESGTPIGDSDIVTLNFGAGFDCTETPDTLITCLLDLTEDIVDISDETNLAAGTGATLTGDTISVDLGTAIDTSEITDGTIDEADIDANTPTDEYCLTYEAAGATIFEWQICGSSAGTLNTIQESGTPIGDSDIVTLNFGAGFDCTETPDTLITCLLDLTEDIVDISDETNLAAGTGATLTGDTISVDLGTAIDTSEITNGTILPDDLNDDAPTDEYCLTYESTGAVFEWQVCGLSTVDISDDTNLSAGTNITLTGDTLNVDDAFILNTGDTGTGVYDFGGSTSFEIPNGAGCTTVNATGEICVDSTSDSINYYDGSVERVLSPIRTISVVIEDPTNAEDISITFVNSAITIVQETCVVVGSSTPSVTVTLRHGTDRNGTGAELNTSGNAITSTTTGNIDSTFNDATIVADSFIWLETTAQSGTVDLLMCSWDYTQDA